MRSQRSSRQLGWLLGFPVLIMMLGYFVDRLGPGADPPDSRLQSTFAVDPAEITKGFPLVSLSVDPEDLDDPVTGILSNVHSRGRAWERAGTLSYFDEGELRFSSEVGVRIHGGGSRFTSPVQSFRVYFREEYGAEAFPPGLLFGGAADPLRRLILHNDVRRANLPSGVAEWAFSNPLAYDISARIGALVPLTMPVRFFLNGEWQGVHVVTENVNKAVNPEFFLVHFGHDRFTDILAPMEELWEWIQAQGRPLTMERIGERIDVPNMTKWFLSVVFCATGDAFQGPGQFRDDSRQGAQWFWINWDMDQSFRSWDVDSFYGLLEQPGERRRGRRPSEPRAVVLTYMLEDDPLYLAYFKQEFARMLNHQVTQEFLDERYQHYETLAHAYGIDDTRFLEPLREFLSSRRDFLWELAERYFDSGTAVSLHLTAPFGGMLVNGSTVAGHFEGRYLPNTSVEVALPEATADSVSYWRVNGEQKGVGSRVLQLLVESDVTIEPILD